MHHHKKKFARSTEHEKVALWNNRAYIAHQFLKTILLAPAMYRMVEIAQHHWL